MPEAIMNLFQIIIGLVSNAVLLFALAFIYGSTNISPTDKNKTKQVLTGVVIGLISILVMMNPWNHTPGIFYDTRSILFSTTGYFYGPVPTLVAMVIGAIYRGIVGGSGAYAGVAVIVFTSLFGLFWNWFSKRFEHRISRPLNYYIFGFCSQLIAILSQFLIFDGNPFEIIKLILFPFLVMYPIFTIVLMYAIQNQKKRIEAGRELKENQILLQASIDSARSMEIYALDSNLNYLAFNKYHEESMKNYYGKVIHIGEPFLNLLKNDQMIYRFKSNFDQTLKGEFFKRQIEIEDNHGKFVEELFAPIYNEHHQIVGITVFSQEITEQKNFEEGILYLSYHDVLTGLHNRRFYTEEFTKIDTEENYPLAVIVADINGLKIMNDAFGHDAGDQLIKTVARELEASFGKLGNVCRIGGDEFTVLIKNTTKQSMLNQVEYTKTMIEKNYIHGMKVSVSFGVSMKEQNIDMNDVIKYAEDDMYKHKLFESSSNRHESIQAILNTLHLKNPREEAHSRRVSQYCALIGELIGMRKDEIEILKLVGNLHDIGKIGIDEAILNKPAALTDEEYASIKRHSEIGYRILSASKDYTEFAEDVLSHHERFDGKGYPQGLKGDEIPLRARIISIADSFDAMTSTRPYRDAFSVEHAISEIMKNAGTQFDPMIASKFAEYMKENKKSF